MASYDVLGEDLFFTNRKEIYRSMPNTNPIIEQKPKRKSSAKDEKIRQLEEMIENNNQTIQALQQMLLNMQAGSMAQPTASGYTDEEVEMIGHSVYPVRLGTPDKRIDYEFTNGDVKNVSVADLKELLKGNVCNLKGLLERGVISFIDEENYEKFHIRKYTILSEDYFKHWLLEESPEKAVEEFNRFTNNKTDFIALHQLVYGLGYILMTTTTFNNWNYNSRVKIEEFFGRKMEDVISSIKAYENRPQ